MAFRPATTYAFLTPVLGLLAMAAAGSAPLAHAQVFVVGEKSATADMSTEFHPTRVELPSAPITERGRRELIRDLEAEQGFAHRALPLGDSLVLMANGNLKPGGEAYKQMIYKKGTAASPGDRVAITAVTVKSDRIIFDLNGGPYLKHRFLRHIELNDTAMVADDGAQVTGCRVTLLFEGGLPEVSAPEVKALLDPIIDFGVKSSAEAFADSLPPFLKEAVSQHDVLVGMNHKMVLAAAGAPESKLRELVPGTTDRHYEEWIYGHAPQTVRFVRFEGDRVTQVRIAALGQAIAIHDKNEMHGYLDPEDTHEVAMGDAKPGNGEEGTKPPPPSILNPGEAAPGSSQQVQMPVAVPTKTDDKTTAPATSQGGLGDKLAGAAIPPEF
ncbi:MAG TPA: hypothetical protein VF865_13530 [Acidobacteriaceae bacterium]